MELTGKQKAAMLLTTLDVTTATELLRGVDPSVVEDLALELSYLDAAGLRNRDQALAVTQEFYAALSSEGQFQLKEFMGSLLSGTLGDERAQQLQNDIQGLLVKRDPFLPVLQASTPALVRVLDSEHPQAVAVVLSELPPKRSSEVLGLLSEGIRVSAVSRMTSVGAMPREAKARIAEIVNSKLEAQASERGGAIKASPEESLRKVALVLRNLEKDQRDGVIAAIRKKDKETAESVTDMMVLWEDIPFVHDRSMQEGLRGLDEGALALALVKAEESINQKIKSNISARAASMVEEEGALLSAPKKKDIEDARDRIVGRLRDLNRNGDLMWQDQES